MSFTGWFKCPFCGEQHGVALDGGGRLMKPFTVAHLDGQDDTCPATPEQLRDWIVADYAKPGDYGKLGASTLDYAGMYHEAEWEWHRQGPEDA